MTDHDADLALQRALIAATQRLLDSTPKPDETKDALKGIKSRRNIRRNHKHSVSHRSYR